VVTKGQVLAKVDPSASQAQLNTASANLTAANASLSRAQAANADSATIANATAQVTAAQADVSAAQRAVAGCVLTAPIAGTVTAVNGAVGSQSGSSQPNQSNQQTSSSTATGFVQLADLTKLQVSGNFAEADATKLRAGQTAAVVWSALSGARATGKVATIAPTATTTNNVNSYAVVVSLDTAPTGVRLGQSTTVTVTVAEADNVLRVPTTAVRTAGGQRTVTVQVNGKHETRAVEVGIQGNQWVEITAGLDEGENVVITTTTNSGTTTNNNFPGVGNFGGGGAGPGGNFGGGGRGGGG
jgi:macrolide-specific efflux system membrane fusion protein